jgi:nucleotide-binding universal stress UspA family protein
MFEVGFSNIVVAVDGSEASQDALTHAVKLARQSKSALTGFFIIDGGWPDFIGNDWQSAKGARQGFLDYIREEQEQQAAAARRQFEIATEGLAETSFTILAGDPTEMLITKANAIDTDLLIVGQRIFQVSGRPSLRLLSKRLAAKATRPLMLFP